jgi:uncharacterized protein (TIGR00296 family)
VASQQQQQLQLQQEDGADGLVGTAAAAADNVDPPPALNSTRTMGYYCFDVLIHSLRYGEPLVDVKRKKMIPNFVSELPDVTVECPIFVTWDQCSTRTTTNNSNNNNNHWQLRGCIGTLAPRLLVDAVGEYAVISALKDRRFRPITIPEISSLRVSVSLLVQYETCSDAYDWTVGVHGIMIKFVVGGQSYSATYLPEVAKEQQWTVPQTVASLVQKAGYYHHSHNQHHHHGTSSSSSSSSPLTPELLRNIQCTRYQSSKCRVTFAEYMEEHCNGTNPLTIPLPHVDSTTSGARSWQSCKQM